MAANYQKQCTGLWIVAPITRAVDDKAAKKLLGDSFRRQLKYDGIYSAVTFICSKTDDILVDEVAGNLGLEQRFTHTWKQIDSVDQKLREQLDHIQAIKDEVKAKKELLAQIEDEMDDWDDLATNLSKGKTVFAPAPKTIKKRKRGGQSSGSRKKRFSIGRSDSDEDDIDSDSDSLSGSDKENGDSGDKAAPVLLTEDQIEEKLSQFKTHKKALRMEIREIEDNIKATRSIMHDLTMKKINLESEIKLACIKGRNTYSRRAIKDHFAEGIKE